MNLSSVCSELVRGGVAPRGAGGGHSAGHGGLLAAAALEQTGLPAIGAAGWVGAVGGEPRVAGRWRRIQRDVFLPPGPGAGKFSAAGRAGPCTSGFRRQVAPFRYLWQRIWVSLCGQVVIPLCRLARTLMAS